MVFQEGQEGPAGEGNSLTMKLISKTQRLDALQQIPSFQGLNRRELAALARLSDEVDVAPGQVLARLGERGREFMLILEGVARVELSNGRRLKLGPGDFFGEMSLIDGEPRSATVVAETPMHLLVINHREFWSLLYEIPQIARKIMVALSQRVRQAQKGVT